MAEELKACLRPHLKERLRGQYAIGPHLPNGKPEFGYRQFEVPPIQQEAASRIESLESAASAQAAEIERLREALERIAAFADKAASRHLAKTGSYGWFDEPSSVQIARTALQENSHE